MKTISKFVKFLGIVFGFLGFLLVLLLVSPWIYVKNRIWGRKLRKKIKAQLKKYDGKIIFLYGEYHTFDFEWYFQKFHPDITCLQVPNHPPMDPFILYLSARNPPKSLPQLVKVTDGHTFKKTHYSSFKYYIRKQKDVIRFFELMERSIKNLQEIE
ncbi:hypothetical protein KORDIASMS9_00511 [Kordia sp. SMS9]|uniref:hypothetical protein n=1 Tax=Kordia sp. SMS9 TaxID=2282170 RepID=UPI000E0D233A|nr:hypothetical protein [Kordia sp. SMS9]AXG68317.1 hypothetical protein KORDIASMS9_00511 [Kordia sp. SMS9]